ncbi:unnamed protein product [Phytophthora fragariaefolia]|uniref:Unnamed protein product n=1 Tax=Phytophthora fragariaefolia TaxID=1490495 RepID=A0A9W6WXI5_9STRA|nr:unnamed protein product [Phytophthora fragariaefolia]
MIAKFDGQLATARQYTALRSWTVRFLKRNRLVVRRISHKGRTVGEEMQDVADVFANAIHVAVDEDGVLSFHKSYESKYSGLFNMDQTVVCMNNPGRLTIDYCGTTNVDVVQGTAINGGRCSVFCACPQLAKSSHRSSFLLVYGAAPSQKKCQPRRSVTHQWCIWCSQKHIATIQLWWNGLKRYALFWFCATTHELMSCGAFGVDMEVRHNWMPDAAVRQLEGAQNCEHPRAP